MSPSLDSAEAQWQTQFAAMRAALAELRLPPKDMSNGSASYSSDINFIEDEGFTSGNSGDDVWDFISDDEEDSYGSDFNEDLTPDAEAGGYGPEWLKIKCLGFAARKQGLSGEDLEQQIMALLVSDSVEEELQSTLTDIFGYDDLDLVIELISHRKEITSAAPPALNKSMGGVGKLLTKHQREEALRQQDYQHKHASLGPNLHRDEPQYPHVYKAHSAGNTLDSRGRKYALPMGSERTEHEVCIHSSCWIFHHQIPLHFKILTWYRNMNSTQFLPARLGPLELDANWSRSLKWMVSVKKPSKATSLLTGCRA